MLGVLQSCKSYQSCEKELCKTVYSKQFQAYKKVKITWGLMDSEHL